MNITKKIKSIIQELLEGNCGSICNYKFSQITTPQQWNQGKSNQSKLYYCPVSYVHLLHWISKYNWMRFFVLELHWNSIIDIQKSRIQTSLDDFRYLKPKNSQEQKADHHSRSLEIYTFPDRNLEVIYIYIPSPVQFLF